MSVLEAIKTLHDYCYSNDHCSDCKLEEFREGWVNKIVDNDELKEKVKEI